MKKDSVTKDDVLRAIQECSNELGHPPSMPELKASKGISDQQIRKHFLTYRQALAECGMVRFGTGYKVSQEALFRDWAELVRKV